jgi:hypothetical protein
MAAYQCLNCGRIESGDEDCCDSPDLFKINDMPGEIRRLRAALAAQTPPPRLTEQEINHCIKFPSAGSAITRDGSTSQRIARAIETAVRAQFGVQE